MFYNPAMAFSRDVSVMVLTALRSNDELPGSPWLEGMTATGIRGLRMALEAGGKKVVLNDTNDHAARLARANVTLNDLDGRVEVTRERVQVLMASRRFGVIDIDPFGTPAPYLDRALQSLPNRGILTISATDLPLLCGAQPSPCRRRYGARPLRGASCAEAGLRMLLGWVTRRAVAYDMAPEPLLGYYEGHHMRWFLRVVRGAGRADRALGQLGYLRAMPDGGHEVISDGDPPGVRSRDIGPLWLGPLADPGLLGRMVADGDLARPDQAARYLGLWRDEFGEDSPVGFFCVDELARAAVRGPPSPRTLVARLIEQDHRATLTHFSPTGIRTNAAWTEAVTICASV